MTFLVTGAAGFIGFHTAVRLLERGEKVLGVDNLNDYYSPTLKTARLDKLREHKNFAFERLDLTDLEGLESAVAGRDIRKVIHLAAQPGVRYSIEHPHAYVQSNLVAHANMLELCRHSSTFEAMCYASSSSVYGGNTKLPFRETDRVDNPISLYAATKKADELMSNVYAHLYRMPLTGLRFFTVYGPYGRPDMAMWLFTEAILQGKPINVFNHGVMKRDFTYIDDIVTGIVAVSDNPPGTSSETPPHRLYNIGNNKSEDLMHMIGLIESCLGRTSEKILLPMQQGDVPATYADITEIQRDHGFSPSTSIDVGVPAFIDWYKSYHGIS